MRVLGRAILIRPDKLPERTKSGLLIPATAKEKPQTGTIEDVGPSCTEAEIGRRVIFPRKSASVIVIDEVDFYFTTENRISYIAADGERIES